jgi:hypothetical protein
MGFVKVWEADAHVRQWSRSFGGEYVPIEDHRGTRHGRTPCTWYAYYNCLVIVRIIVRSDQIS